VITSPSVAPAVRASVDHEFDAVIADALGQDAKAPGYKEFMAQLTALSSIIPDKGQCVKAALAAVTAINPSLNATVVARAIGERLKLLTGYQESYDSESRKSEENETSDKRSAIGEIETRLRDIDTEIQRLAGERAQCETQAAKLNSELQGTGTKYDDYRARFNGTVQARREELKTLLKAVAPGATEEE
jgi:predicted RNase H-like nuclease (RuvC/YqgF family)